MIVNQLENGIWQEKIENKEGRCSFKKEKNRGGGVNSLEWKIPLIFTTTTTFFKNEHYPKVVRRKTKREPREKKTENIEIEKIRGLGMWQPLFVCFYFVFFYKVVTKLTNKFNAIESYDVSDTKHITQISKLMQY